MQLLRWIGVGRPKDLRGFQWGSCAGGHGRGGGGRAVLPLAQGKHAQRFSNDVAVVEIAAGGDCLLDEGVEPLSEFDSPGFHGTPPTAGKGEWTIVLRSAADSATGVKQEH